MRGCQACDWGRVVDEQGRTTWPLGLPAVCLQGSLGVWPRQEGMTSWKWGSRAGLLVWRDVPAAGFTRGAPLPTAPPNLCHHPFFSESSSILQLADEVLWACLAFVKSRWEGAGHVAGGDPAGAELRLSGQARALREPEDA